MILMEAKCESIWLMKKLEEDARSRQTLKISESSRTRNICLGTATYFGFFPLKTDFTRVLAVTLEWKVLAASDALLLRGERTLKKARERIRRQKTTGAWEGSGSQSEDYQKANWPISYKCLRLVLFSQQNWIFPS